MQTDYSFAICTSLNFPLRRVLVCPSVGVPFFINKRHKERHVTTWLWKVPRVDSADEREMTGEHCLKVTPGDSLSDVRETAGSILSDSVFDRLLFWQWLQCTKCWVGKRIMAEGHHLPMAGERRESEELRSWNTGEVRLGKSLKKPTCTYLCKHQKLHPGDHMFGMNGEWIIVHVYRYGFS